MPSQAMTGRPAPPTSDNRQRAFIDVLAQMPGLCARLLAEHVPDRTGTRCRACTTTRTASPTAAWPCRIHDLAETARIRRAHRSRSPEAGR